MPSGGLVVVHWNTDAGAPGAGPVPGGVGRDFFTGPLAGLSPERGCLILSRGSDLLNAPAMLAFVQWGAPDQKGADVANSLGLWPRDQFLPPIAPGHSLALAPGGSPRSPTGWFDAASGNSPQ